MYKVLTLKDTSVWLDYFNKLPATQQDVYFSPTYYSLYDHNGDGKAQCFVFEDGDKLLLYPYLKNSINSLGYQLDDEYFDIQGAYGYNGIVTSSFDETFLNAFHECFDKNCAEQHIVAEFSRFHPLLDNQRWASPKMKTFYSRRTVKLDLILSMDDIWMKQISTKNRNIIRKAEKDGVTVLESQDYELFRQMYDQTMRNLDAEAFYFFPKAYYDEFKDTFGDNIILCFAMYEGQPISGSMFMFSKDYAHYHLSGRDRNFYKIPGNNAVLWYGIQKAKERGCKWIHLGGGTTGEDDDRLLHFKKNFSKDEGEFWIGKRVHNQIVYDQIVEQWKNNHPESYEKNRIKLLGYREF